MGTRQKKGQKGAAASYLTRTQALKRLQISLKDFRRLCILKGVYPRAPHRRLRGRDKTYYLSKDIRFLQHEPLLDHLREFRVWKRRYTRAKARGDEGVLKKIATSKPQFRLDAILRERYPTFEDALRDLDDALCSVHLFARLPAQRTVPPSMIQNAARVVAEWQAYVVETHALRKVFLSIKGVYYQADVRGVNVTWLEPWLFNTTVPRDIDISVMMTFLDMHMALLRFVLFRLYAEAAVAYPPVVRALDDSAAGAPPFAQVALTHLRDGEAAAAAAAAAAGSDESPGAAGAASDGVDASAFLDPTQQQAQRQRNDEAALCRRLFAPCVVFLSREVPVHVFALLVRSGGGVVGWDGPGSPLQVNDPRITHQVCDRPQLTHRFLAREYVQPQWIADSLNARVLLPTAEYAPGVMLPAHLSPFVDNTAEGYTPARAMALEAARKAAGVTTDDRSAATAAAAAAARRSDAESESDSEGGSGSEAEAGAGSEPAVPSARVRTRDAADAKAQRPGAAAANEPHAGRKMTPEERARARMMLSKKQRRRYDRVAHSAAAKEKQARKLAERAQH